MMTLEDINDVGDEDKLHLNDGLADNEDIAFNGVQHEHENQHNFLVVLIKMKNNRTI